MPISAYPFLAIGPGQIARPMLPIRIINPENNLSILQWGLIDTGADECALPAWIAVQLGHELSAGTASSIGTGNGTTTAYSHKTIIEILKVDRSTGKSDDATIVHTIPNTSIDYIENLHCVLLGVTSFLGHFKLTIDYPQNCFSINKHTPSSTP